MAAFHVFSIKNITKTFNIPYMVFTNILMIKAYIQITVALEAFTVQIL